MSARNGHARVIGRCSAQKKRAPNHDRSYHPDQGAQQNSTWPTPARRGAGQSCFCCESLSAQVGRSVGSKTDVRTSFKLSAWPGQPLIHARVSPGFCKRIVASTAPAKPMIPEGSRPGNHFADAWQRSDAAGELAWHLGSAWSWPPRRRRPDGSV